MNQMFVLISSAAAMIVTSCRPAQQQSEAQNLLGMGCATTYAECSLGNHICADSNKRIRIGTNKGQLSFLVRRIEIGGNQYTHKMFFIKNDGDASLDGHPVDGISLQNCNEKSDDEYNGLCASATVLYPDGTYREEIFARGCSINKNAWTEEFKRLGITPNSK
jgi:hypothetical protein